MPGSINPAEAAATTFHRCVGRPRRFRARNKRRPSQVISHLTADFNPAEARKVDEMYKADTLTLAPRTRDPPRAR
ncbi:hypothetical protein ACWD04_06825 [Streptomyces sp. NPDC002911]